MVSAVFVLYSSFLFSAAKACQAEEQRLAAENDKLKKEVARLKDQLIAAEEDNGGIFYVISIQ